MMPQFPHNSSPATPAAQASSKSDGAPLSSSPSSSTGKVDRLQSMLSKLPGDVTAQVLKANLVSVETRGKLIEAALNRQGLPNSSLASTPSPSASLSSSLNQANKPQSSLSAELINKLQRLPASLQALLQSSKLQLVELKLLTPTSQRILTFSDQSLKAGQTVQLGKANDALGQAQLNVIKSNTANSNQLLQTQLAEALKNALPQQLHQKNAQRVIQQLQTLLPLLATTQGQNSASTTNQNNNAQLVLQRLQTLLQQAPNVSQLSTPTGLKQALQNSGLQLEQQLHTLTAPQANRTANPPLTGAATQPPLSQASLSSADSSTSLKSLINKDLKAVLVYLLQAIAPQSTSPLNIKPISIDPSLDKLFAQWLQPSSQGDSKTQPTHDKVQQLIQQLAHHLLHKIQLQQLQSLNKQWQNREAGQNTQHFQLEIPIRFGQEYHHLGIQMDEEWYYTKKEESNGDSEDAEQREQVRQWQVKLTFDLPEAGAVHAHLSVINDSVSASLWAEKTDTLEKAKRNLETLRERLDQEGLDVKQLDCFPGKPVDKSTQLGFNLVDIKT